MKTRDGIVADSSDLSFITGDIGSKVFTDIVKEYLLNKKSEKTEFSDEHVEIKLLENDRVFFTVNEGKIKENLLNDKKDYIGTALDVLCFFLSDKELSEEILKNKDKIEEDTYYADIDFQNSFYGENNDRYDKNKYDSETLEYLLNDISEKNNCSVDEITDEMFFEYISEKVETSSKSMLFENNIANFCNSFYVDNNKE